MEKGTQVAAKSMLGEGSNRSPTGTKMEGMRRKVRGRCLLNSGKGWSHWLVAWGSKLHYEGRGDGVDYMAKAIHTTNPKETKASEGVFGGYFLDEVE